MRFRSQVMLEKIKNNKKFELKTKKGIKVTYKNEDHKSEALSYVLILALVKITTPVNDTAQCITKTNIFYHYKIFNSS